MLSRAFTKRTIIIGFLSLNYYLHCLYSIYHFIFLCNKMVSATAVVTDNSTMVTVKLPKEFNVDFSKDKELEGYLSDIIFDALLDYREIKQDAELKEKLSKNERFQSLNKQMEEAVGRI